MYYFHMWSGGKDSTAGVILDHIYGLPPSTIVFSEVVFDKKRGISGEWPEHIDFVKNKAKPVFENWGYKVEIISAEKDYLDLFFHTIKHSSNEKKNGKIAGFLLGGKCAGNSRLKIRPIRDYFKSLNLKNDEYIQYVGIAADEPIRLERLRGTNEISLLERYGYTEKKAFELCKEYDLLSPVYKIAKRNGCWFCPNATYQEMAYIKRTHPELWEKLYRLSKEKNMVSTAFKYTESFDDVDKKISKINANLEIETAQLSLFDFL